VRTEAYNIYFLQKLSVVLIQICSLQREIIETLEKLREYKTRIEILLASKSEPQWATVEQIREKHQGQKSCITVPGAQPRYVRAKDGNVEAPPAKTKQRAVLYMYIGRLRQEQLVYQKKVAKSRPGHNHLLPPISRTMDRKCSVLPIAARKCA
jgi:hypothetical protein